MDQHTPYGTRLPRTSAHSGPGRAVALAVVGALCLLLWAATLPRVGTAVAQTGRPGYDAQVVSCPQPGGFIGRCEIAVTRDGQEIRTSLADPGMMIPQAGDRLTVSLDEDGTARPAGWRPWATAGLLVALSLALTRATISRMQDAMLAYAVDEDEFAERPSHDNSLPGDGRDASEDTSGEDVARRSRPDQDAA
ncbi:hypothetical protein SAMN05421595_3060 [Austwickia chelonae]|uniref:Uncharacterized protein n=1 Tax=Austwickia chelonae NBRC 105200 TaxID=1184607 RepID=K6WC28_9MICO|nr:hypothetical protein [Austwickia chelonae]GAB79397.1 hypothetical protein AUCHE_24_00520 [Austwickia chelonae NBRC 105200]SEW43554.1 hypothetical protein SAMN05421595_3060 [Austwickia chelonae]